jgi:pyruvate dehydrogenase E1 component beta subunit
MTETTRRTIIEAVHDGLRTSLSADDSVVVFGEDVGELGGVFRATDGLAEAFPDRVVDTPLSEVGILGAAVGLAAHGLTPVPEIQFQGFVYPGFDQLLSHIARLRTRTHGAFDAQIVVRMPYGGGPTTPENHSDSMEALFVHQPGLKVAVPSTPRDAKGMLVGAIRDPDPVVFLEPHHLYRSFREDVPDGDFEIPLGEASVRRAGEDVTVFTYGAMTRPVLETAGTLEGDVDVEVVDFRSLVPMDRETILDSFRKTKRAVVVHEGPKTAGVGAELTRLIQEHALFHQQAPVKCVTGFDVPVPLYSQQRYYLPSPPRIEAGIRETMEV